MKILISKSMNAKDYTEQAHEAATYIRYQLHSIFDYNYTVNTYVHDVGYLTVYLSNVAPRCSTLQHQKASLKLKFKLRLTDLAGVQSDLETFKFEVDLISEAAARLRLPLVFDTTDSPMKAAKDLTIWFKKNAKALTAII